MTNPRELTDEDYAAFAQSLLLKSEYSRVKLGKLIYHYGTLRANEAKILQAHSALLVQRKLADLTDMMAQENDEILAELEGSTQKLETIFNDLVLPS